MTIRVKPKMATGNMALSRGSSDPERHLGDGVGVPICTMLKKLGPQMGKYARGQPEREATPALSSWFLGGHAYGFLPFGANWGLG